MNIRTTKIVAPLVAMALCTPDIAFAQEELNHRIISGKTDVNDNVSLTRSISAINRDNSTSQDLNTIYVNPGDIIHVRLDLKGKTDSGYHAFTSFKEEVSPIETFSPNLGSRTVKKRPSSELQKTTLDKLDDGTFEQIDQSTIEFKVDNSGSPFGVLAHQITIDYSYTARNKPGRYETKFIPNPKFAAGSTSFDPEKLNLTVVVKDKERPAPPDQDERPAPPDQDERPAPPDQDERPAPPDQDERPAPPDQDEQVIPPKSNRSTGFSWLTKALGVLAFLGGTVWFIIKNIFRL